jgi:hypothetical protein
MTPSQPYGSPVSNSAGFSTSSVHGRTAANSTTIARQAMAVITKLKVSVANTPR